MQGRQPFHGVVLREITSSKKDSKPASRDLERGWGCEEMALFLHFLQLKELGLFVY